VSITLFFVRNEIVPIIQDHSASKTPDLVTCVEIALVCLPSRPRLQPVHAPLKILAQPDGHELALQRVERVIDSDLALGRDARFLLIVVCFALRHISYRPAQIKYCVLLKSMRLWVPTWGKWVTVDRATPSTRRADRRIWRQQNLASGGHRSIRTERLLRRVEDAGYRTTVIVPDGVGFLTGGQRKPLYSYVMAEMLSDMERNLPDPRTPPGRTRRTPPRAPQGVRRAARRRHAAFDAPAVRLAFAAYPWPPVAPRQRIIRNGNRSHVMTANTAFIGRNFSVLNALRNIPAAKRVYLNPDVNSRQQIKQVYHEDGLREWLQRSQTSPYTRRQVTLDDVRRLPLT